MSAREILWWSAADELGLLPDPLVEGALLRATTLNCHAGRSVVDALDLLPDAYRDRGRAEAEAEHMAERSAALRGYFSSLRAQAGAS